MKEGKKGEVAKVGKVGRLDKQDGLKLQSRVPTPAAKEAWNTLDDDMIKPFMLTVAEIAKCYDNASPSKNHLEYNRSHDFESVLSCISDDLYSNAIASNKN